MTTSEVNHLYRSSDSKHSATILVVDEDREVVKIVSLMLRALGYCVLTAGDGRSAFRMVASAGHPKIDILLTGYRMPHMPGNELVSRFHEASPETAMVMMASEQPAVSPALRCEFLRKPFHMNELFEKMQVALAA